MANVELQPNTHHEQKLNQPTTESAKWDARVESVHAHVPVQASNQSHGGPSLPDESMKTRTTFLIHWWLEILSYLVGLVGFGAIVLTLSMHHGKPLPKWPKYITVNSLISVFTAIMKASLILPVAEGISELKWLWFAKSHTLYDMHRFDSASRGPLGALIFLCRIRWSMLPALGAIITILALAIDPFTQQIVHYYTCAQPTDHTATISRSNNYTARSRWLNSRLIADEGPTLAAIYDGLLNPLHSATDDVPFTCKSGNCEFSSSRDNITYRSLAMCSSVSDLSHLITGNGSMPLFYYSLPSGLSVYGVRGSKSLPINWVLRSSMTGAEDLGSDRPIFSYDTITIWTNCTLHDASSHFQHCFLKPFAFRSQLYPCVHTYGKVRISDSVLQEPILSTKQVPFTRWHNYPFSGGHGTYSLVGDYPSFPGVDCSPAKSPRGNKTQPTSLYRNGQRAVVNYVDTNGPYKDMLWYDPRCTYQLDYGISVILRIDLERFFGHKKLPQGVLVPYEDPLSGWSGKTPWLLRLYASGNATLESATTFIQGFANYMTARMRREGDPTNSAPAEGMVLISETCIRVDWIWLTADGVLLLLALIFFSGTMWQSSTRTTLQPDKTYRGPWKSSVLPLVWCGLEDETKETLGLLDEVQDMEAESKKLKVHLKRSEQFDSKSHFNERPLSGDNVCPFGTGICASADGHYGIEARGSDGESSKVPGHQHPDSHKSITGKRDSLTVQEEQRTETKFGMVDEETGLPQIQRTSRWILSE